MVSEARPLIDFKQQFGDLDVRQDHGRLVDQHLRGVGHRRIQWHDFQTRLGDDGIRQVVDRRHPVDHGELRFEQHQALAQGLVAVGGNGQRQCAELLVASKLLGRHQVVLEVLELALTLHPDVTRAQRVLEFRQRAQLVVAPADAGVGHHQLFPSLLDEAGRRVGRHLAGVVGVHAAQHLNGVEHVLGSGRSPKLEHVEEFRRVAAQGGVVFADAVQEVEVIWLSELLRLGDALGEGVPGHNSFDSGEQVAARLLGVDQRLADAPYKRTLALMALPDA